MTTRRTVYLYPEDSANLEVLKADYSLGTSAACRAGIALLLAHLRDGDRQDALDQTVGPIRRKEKNVEDWRLTTEDRNAQVGWLRDLAGNIAANLGKGTAEELVKYALSREGRESWGITIPEWYSLHDHELLIQWVGESL